MRHLPVVVLATLLGWLLFGGCQPSTDVAPSTGATQATKLPAGKELNLGTIIRGAERHGAFPFANTTDEWIEVRRWRTSCECVLVKTGCVEVAPGDVSKISVIAHFPPEGQSGRVRVLVEGIDAPGDPVVMFDVVMRLADQDDTVDGKRLTE